MRVPWERTRTGTWWSQQVVKGDTRSLMIFTGRSQGGRKSSQVGTSGQLCTG